MFDKGLTLISDKMALYIQQFKQRLFLRAAIGAFAIIFLNEALHPAGTFRLLVLGILIVVTMLYMPQGLIGMIESIGRSIRRISKGRLKLSR